ncbi:uncharacterized protein LOC114174413 [Vigna unguiculata]|uniref:uncharacterized protein LOC114174413 n=1 Tax=Vigna unguiculata TaxID=3917 RepID=UPI001016A3CF|nr:uncharacterized protein LOC114174413 [Vigna unguiculata]
MGGTLEVDESHLHAFMRHCSETTSFIPGSARNFQVVLMNYKASQGHSTQQFMEDIATTTFARDFGTNVWKWATMFMKHHGLVDEGDIKNVTTMFTTKRVDRLPFVACVVKDYKPNGLGDLFITMKDQTHTAQANIHNKAVSNLECGLQIGVEFVILLKEFGIHKSTPDKLYLNITLKNIVKERAEKDPYLNKAGLNFPLKAKKFLEAK